MSTKRSHILNPFHATGLFLYALKTRGFLIFSRSIEKDRGMKWVNQTCSRFFKGKDNANEAK